MDELYDVVVVGGGSTGCVVAARLAAAGIGLVPGSYVVLGDSVEVVVDGFSERVSRLIER